MKDVNDDVTLDIFTSGRTCNCCGQKIRKLNPHRMCRSKVRLLQHIASYGGDWVKISTGDTNQLLGDAAVLALRLQWFGLIENGGKRSGLYRVTPEGIAFLHGKHAVPKIIWCRDSKVVERDTVMVTIGSIKNVVLDKDYWDTYHLQQR